MPRLRIVRPARGQGPEALEIDRHDRQNGPQLDHDLEGLALTLEAQEVAQQQQVASRGDGDELGQPLDDAQDDRRDPVRHNAVSLLSRHVRRRPAFSQTAPDRRAVDCTSWHHVFLAARLLSATRQR